MSQDTKPGRVIGRSLPVWILAAAIFSACNSPGGRFNVKQQLGSTPDNPLSYQENLLMSSFPGYSWEDDADYVEDEELTKAFSLVRATPGWKAFEVALATCDRSVNSLLDSNILQDYGPKIARVNDTRDARRKASVYGITPPDLPRGWTKFKGSELSFTLHVPNDRLGILLVQASRGQMLGVKLPAPSGEV